ncbi:Uncharacterised protein [uncultured Comamonas sp.]|nr:Uncharacterised protein [uncultured Comamonas sp.]
MLLSNLNLLATAPGGVARLRELILTLAVQGKLVPQDPADEPASRLLQKIRAEKDRLIAEGKIKKDKPLPPIAEEEKPFELPEGWEWVRFGEVLDFQGGGQPPKSNFSEVPLPDYVQLIQIRDLGDKPQPVYIPRKLASKFCTTSDVMVGRYGASVGKVFWGKEGAYNVALVKMVDEHQVFDRRFLFQLLLSPIGQSLFAGISRSAQDGFNKNDIEAKLIPLAPLAEQSRIVARVEELMRLCDALEAKGQLETTQHAQLLSTLLGTLTASATPEELAANWQRVAQHFDLLLDRPEAIDALEQTLLQLAVRGLLVPQDPADEPASVLLQKIRAEKDRLIAAGQIKRDKPLPPITDEEKPFALPVGWEWVRFDELIHPQKPIAYGVLVPGPDVSQGVPFVRIADLSIANPPERPEKTITPEVDAQFPRTRLEGGEILMGVVGSIGKLGVAPKTWAGANIARAICRIVPADAGLHEFVLFLLETKFMQESFAGDTRTLAQPTLNIGLIRAALTPMPPPAEQSRIVTRVTELRRLCFELRQRLAEREAVQARLAEALVQQVA